MDRLLEYFYGPAAFFLLPPVRAFMMAAGYAILAGTSSLHAGGFQLRQHLAALLAAILWSLFGMNELHAIDQGWNIRVDVLIFWWPALLVFSLGAAGQEFYSLVRRIPRTTPPQ